MIILPWFFGITLAYFIIEVKAVRKEKITSTYSYDTKIKYFRFDVSMREWNNTFNDNTLDVYGPVHLWSRCVNNNVRGFLAIEPTKNFFQLNFKNVLRFQNMAMNFQLHWAKYEFHLTINNEKMILKHSKLHWGKHITHVSSFDHVLKSDSEFVEIKINGWNKLHVLRRDELCVHENFKKTLSGTNISASSLQPKHTIRINVFDDQARSDKTEFFKSLETHMKFHFHQLLFSVSSYHIALRSYDLKHILDNAYLSNAMLTGRLNVFSTPSYLIETKGNSYRWEAILENLVALYYWKTPTYFSNLDLDEFLLSERPILDHITKKQSCVYIPRITIISDKSKHNIARADKNNLLEPNSNLKWIEVSGIKYFEHPKMLINPDKASCLYVHWNKCNQPCNKLKYNDLKIYHFIDYFTANREKKRDFRKQKILSIQHFLDKVKLSRTDGLHSIGTDIIENINLSEPRHKNDKLYNSYDSKINHFRFEPSMNEWELCFGRSSWGNFGPVDLWLRCVNNSVRGFIAIEPIENLNKQAQDRSMSFQLNWDTNNSKFNVNLNDESVRLVLGGKHISTFDHELKSDSVFVEIKINDWNKLHVLRRNELCVHENFKKTYSGTDISKTSRQPAHVTTIYHQDGLDLLKHNKTQVFKRLETQMKFHKQLPTSSYHVTLRPYDLKRFQHNAYLSNAMSSGQLKVFLTPSYFTESKDDKYKFQAALENLVALYYWKTSTYIRKLDPDF